MNTDDLTTELPEGWAFPAIRECVELKYGKGLPKRKRVKGNVRVYGSNGAVGFHNQSVTGGETIVIGRKGTVGAVHYSDSPCWPIDTTYFIDEFYGFNTAYLTHALRYLDLARLESSTAIPGLNRDDIYNEHFPLAPQLEQVRIIDKVEELLNSVEKAKIHLERVPEIIEKFRKAVLNAACSGRLTEDWREKHPNVEPALKLAEKIRQKRLEDFENAYRAAKAEGIRRPKKPNFFDVPVCEPVERGIPSSWVRVLGAALFSWSSGKFLPQKKLKLGKYPVYGGHGVSGYHKDYLVANPTLVIGRVGAHCGNVYITPGKVWVTDNAIYASYVPSEAILKYLYFVFNNSNINAKSGGSGQPFVNQTILDNVLIPFPSYDEQKEIVRRVEGLFKFADSIQKRLEVSTAKVEKLTQSILYKAFRGELVPIEAELALKENRTYETAEQLLKRIKLEREKKRTIVLKVSEKIKIRSKVMGVLRGPKKRPILEVLSKAQGKLKPEELFRKANFTEEFVDDFYEELREAVQTEQIKELRPKKTEIYLEAVKT